MRFAYIDSQGKEVPIPTVDALRLRIALKAIVEDTMFFDASSERWAPARDHEIYRTLSRELAQEDEPGFVAPPPPVEGLDGAGELEVEDDEIAASSEEDVSGDDDLSFAISYVDEAPDAPDAGREGPVDEVDDAAPPEGPSTGNESQTIEGFDDIHVVAFDESGPEATDPVAGAGLEGGDGAEERPGTGRAGGEEDAGRDDALGHSEGPIGSNSWIDLDMEGEEDARFDLDGMDLSDPPEAAAGGPIDLVPELGGPRSSEPPVAAPLEGLQQDRHDFEGLVEEAGWGDEPPPDDLEVEPTMVDPDAEAAPAAPRGPREVEPPLPSREELARRSAPARAGPAGGAPSQGRPGAPAGRSRPTARRRSSGRGGAWIGAVAVLGLGAAGAAWWFVGQRGGADAAEPAAAVAVPDVPEALQPHVDEVGPAVREETHAALRALPAQVGLPPEPPTRWLAGDYLAGASAFEDVEAYWTAMDRFLRTMQAREDSIFSATLSDRVAERGLAEAEAEQVEARILAGFRATARERGAVYQQARAVGESALRLHNFLRENEPSITYEPGVSSDPVLEAIPATPALGEDMWERVNEITEAMDALDFLDRVTTERFVDAVIRRLEAVRLR